ncbi:hypothetical protein DFJ77DRAFT_319716 [Powellomyces hirtus]|nr:hypothetical protein DFJ77DRAFT_319716 [Powellomyces hirtus]
MLRAFLTVRSGHVADSSSTQDDIAAIHKGLSEQLPAYQVPASIVIVDELPVTSGGKVDRKALESLANKANKQRPPTLDEKTAKDIPQSEKIVETVWRELLPIEGAIQPASDFFSLGGHSFLSLRLRNRLEELSARKVISALFENSTFEQMTK